MLVVCFLCRRVLRYISETPQAAAPQAQGRVAWGGRARAAPARPQAQAGNLSAAAGRQCQPSGCRGASDRERLCASVFTLCFRGISSKLPAIQSPGVTPISYKMQAGVLRKDKVLAGTVGSILSFAWNLQVSLNRSVTSQYLLCRMSARPKLRMLPGCMHAQPSLMAGQRGSYL